MNSHRNKWWGAKHLLFFCSLIMMLGISFIYSSYLQNTVKAEGTIIDDSPLGEKIVDIEGSSMTGTKVAITESGHVYAWGPTSDFGKLGDGNTTGRSDSQTPRLVMTRKDDKLVPLQNIVKVAVGGNESAMGWESNGNFMYSMAGTFVIALDTDGNIYGWGDNHTRALGLPNDCYYEAIKLAVDFKVKDFDCSMSGTFLISTTGELHTSGSTIYGDFGLGPQDINTIFQVPVFTKVETDYNGNPLTNLNQVEASGTGLVMLLTNDNLLFVNGNAEYTGVGSNQQIGKFKEASFLQGTPQNGLKGFYNIIEAISGILIRGNDGKLYSNIDYVPNTNNSTYKFNEYQNVNVKGTYKYNDPHRILSNASDIYISVLTTVISSTGNLYISDNSMGNMIGGNSVIISFIPYAEGDITTEYRNAKKFFYTRKDKGSTLLSNAGSVYEKGIKKQIGSISLSATRSDNTEYTSASKHNGDVTITIDGTLAIPENINVKVKDLITNSETTSKMSDASITVTSGNERVYKEYTFYYDGQEDQGKTFIVDLYQHAPETSDLTNNGTYKVGKTISFTDNVLPNNTVTATLSKNGGTATDFTSGAAINDEGSYSLVLKDLYGNTNTYAFKISNAESAESISFTKSSAGNLIVGNTITKIGNVVGTITLNYPTGVTPSTIDSMTIDQTGDGANFEVYGKDGLKVITKDLEAREYVVSVSGTDANGLAFSGTIKFTIEKIPLSLEIQLKNKNQVYQSSVTYQLGDTKPAEQIQIVGNSNVDLSTLGKPVFSYKKDGKPVASPMNEKGTYTVTASYPAGTADNYDITLTNATLIVEDLIIDESNISDFVKLESDGKPYTQGTWTKDDIIITPIHPVFTSMLVDHTGTQSSAPYTYSEEGEHNVKLTFYTSEGAEVSTDVTLNLDTTAPVITQFNYEEETSLRSMLRAITFDHYFGKAQQLSFSGTDETGGSGLASYRYEIVELDKDKNEKPASKKTGTLGLNEKLNLSINTSYRISAWAVDVAGNESEDEMIERVFLSDEAAQLNISATSDGKAYDGSKWVSKPINITLFGTSTAGVQKYQYSKDGVIFHDLAGNTITLPDPLEAMNNTPYTFRAINQDGTESDQVFYLKVDPVKPTITVKGSVNGSDYDGSATDQNVIITPSQTNQSISGIIYYYTTNPSSKNSDPLTDKNWKKYSSPVTHSVNGTYTYYFKAISGAGIGSETKEYTVNLNKKEYTELQVNVTTEGKNYSPGNWAKHDITFTLSGGMKDISQITGYEYTTTSGAKPNVSADWKPVTGASLAVEENVIDRTYWFRVLPSDPEHKVSTGIPINLDVDKPSVPVLTMKYENKNAFAQLINTLSFGEWMNKQAVITMKSTDETSGIDHYEYEESSKTNSVTMKSKDGIIRYGDETEVIIRAKACDKAGNCSEFGDSEEVKVDMKAPSILGVKDQSIYVQYYLPRFVSVKDDLSGIAQATYTKTGDSAIDIIGETKIEGEGIYQVYAKDEAGNEGTLQFKIVRLPYIETEIDGSDESREIIDQVIDELEEGRSKLEPDEIKDIEQWIKEAEEKWDSLRRKVIETDDKAAKVEGQGDTTFDPNTELIVEEIPKDKVPVLPRNAIKTYDVYLRKGKDIVLPDGSVKVYLPYTEEEPPIVYEISEDGTFKELIAVKEGDYVTFITNTLKKYAISNEKQKENKPDPIPDPKPNPDDGKNDQVCVAGPDGKLGTADDVCGEGNDTKEPDKGSDGSVTVPDGGSVIFPNGNEVELPDGGIIKPDGSVELPDGSTIDKDGNKKPKVCEIKDGIILNKDSDGDGLPDLNLDMDNDCSPDLNIDFDNDGIPDFNIDSTGDGKADVNVDYDNDGFVDQNEIKLNKWIPNLNSKVNDFAYDTMSTEDINANSDEIKTPTTNNNQNDSSSNTTNGADTKINGTYHNNASVGGAGTGDTTKWTIWGILVALTLCTLSISLYKKYKQKV